MSEQNATTKNYMLFYGITYFGSALTSVSSFFMVEKLMGSLQGLGLALALKTAFIALISPQAAKVLGKCKLSVGLMLSQLLGLILLLPLWFGIQFDIVSLFIIGIIVGGLPGVFLNLAGTSFLKIYSGNDIHQFRENQGRLQLIIGLCFTLSAVVSPILLEVMSYSAVLLIDLATYLFGALYLLLIRKKLDVANQNHVAGEGSNSDVAVPSYFALPVLIAGLGLSTVYLLKGLPPLMAGNKYLTDSLNFNPLWRRSFWALEAVAGIVSGYLYRHFHRSLGKGNLYLLGLINSAFLGFLFVGNYIAISLGIFLLSTVMTITFMKLRDDFIGQYSNKKMILWATGYTSLVMNLTLTASPLLISFTVERIGVLASALLAIGIQLIAAVFVLRYRNAQEEQANLTGAMTGLGRKSILAFLFLLCCMLTVVLHTFEKRRAEKQMEIWTQSITKSIIPQLVDGDYVPIFSKLKLLQQTELFNDFKIFDSAKVPIASFGNNNETVGELIPIKDEVGSIWGYFSYSPDAMYWWYSLSFLLPTILLLVVLIGILIQKLLVRQIAAEISSLSRFIEAIESYSTSISSAPDTRDMVPFRPQIENLKEIDRIASVVENLALQIVDRQRHIHLKEIEIVRSQKAAEISRQVAHDIRSPVSALNMAISGLENNHPSALQLIRMATQRINNIANDLLSKSKESVAEKQQRKDDFLLSVAIEDLCSEKRAEFAQRPSLQLELKIKGGGDHFICADQVEVMRALSNIINNAIEAAPESDGQVLIGLDSIDEKLILSVQDNGSGIPSDVLAKVGQKGFTFGKEGSDSGSGLGVFHAKRTMMQLGGSLLISSKNGNGTKVDMTFPVITRPAWFASDLTVDFDKNVITVDDDTSVHEMWRTKFESLNFPKSNHLRFHSSNEFFEHTQIHSEWNKERPLVLIDYDFGKSDLNGLEIVKKMKEQADFVLVTGSYDDKAIQKQCMESNIKIIPKPFIRAISIQTCVL